MNSKRLFPGLIAMIAIASAAMASDATAGEAAVGIRKAPIYPSIEAAETDIRAAVTEAQRTHKRIILDSASLTAFLNRWKP